MERCLQRGLAKHIGVSNFTIAHLQTILATATTKPAVNQVETHPYMQQPELHAFMKEEGILAVGFAPLAPLRVDTEGETVRLVKRIAAKYGVGEGTVLLRWVIGRGSGVVTTSGKRERLAQILAEVPRFELTTDEIAEIGNSAGQTKVRTFFVDDFATVE